MAPKETLFLGLKGPCDCFHMVGQHGDRQDELKPRSIWRVPQHCPSTAVILHSNIWVIAHYAWELSVPPILGIAHWQHAGNSSAPHSCFSHMALSCLKHYHREEFHSVSVVVTQREKNDILKRGMDLYELGFQHSQDWC